MLEQRTKRPGKRLHRRLSVSRWTGKRDGDQWGAPSLIFSEGGATGRKRRWLFPGDRAGVEASYFIDYINEAVLIPDRKVVIVRPPHSVAIHWND